MQLAGLQSNKAVINFDRNVAEARKSITIQILSKNDKLSFIFINHDLSIDLVSLVPAKQFAPVVVLKAGLVRFPMLSPPSDSTY